MFHKSPEILWNALFNIPQGLTMTIAMGNAVLKRVCGLQDER